jgi:hypothetical protein
MKALVLSLLLAAGPLAAAETATLQHDSNVRALPDRSSRIKTALSVGTTVELLAYDTRNGYSHVRLSPHRSGWIWAKNLSPSVRTPPAPPAPRQPIALATPLAATAAIASTASTADRAHQLASHAMSVHGNFCGNISDEKTCHGSFADGCTSPNKKNDPNTYDAYLSYVKNTIPKPADADGAIVATLASLDDVQALDQQLRDKHIGKDDEAGIADELADIGQGNFYAVDGYLYYAKDGGIETCNCKLSKRADIDFHIGIGFDSAMASDIADGTVVFSNKPSKRTKEAERTSMIVEMSPHYRAKYHPDWTQAQLARVKGRKVRVVGQLLADTEHNLPAQNCAFPNATKSTCWRASVWEIHPVMRFLVCKSGTACGDNDWDDLENVGP